MRHVPFSAVGVLLLAGALTACATTPAGSPGLAASPRPDAASSTATPQATEAPSTDAAAAAQAQAWREGISLPDGATPQEAPSTSTAGTSYHWPCTPVEQLEGWWTVPDTTLADVASWVLAHPPADLITTTPGQTMDDPSTTGGTLGFVPALDAQEGVVLHLLRSGTDVTVHAEIAAMADDAECTVPPGGGTWGAPGQG